MYVVAPFSSEQVVFCFVCFLLVLLGFSLVFVLFCSGVQPAPEFPLLLPPLCDFSVTRPPIWTQRFLFVVFSIFLRGGIKTVFAKQTSLSDLYQPFWGYRLNLTMSQSSLTFDWFPGPLCEEIPKLLPVVL